MASLRAIVAAAGSGQRFDPGTPKLLVEIAGRSVLEWSVERLAERVREIVVAAPADLMRDFEERLGGRSGVRVVAGGATRSESVGRALAALGGSSDDLIAIHDAARPALHPIDFSRVVAMASENGAAVLGRPVSDTLKRVRGSFIESTVDRNGLFRAETPQVFRRGLLERAFALAGASDADPEAAAPTDESSLVERLGSVRIVMVPAERPNPKLTVAGDLPLLASLLEQPSYAGSAAR